MFTFWRQHYSLAPLRRIDREPEVPLGPMVRVATMMGMFTALSVINDGDHYLISDLTF